MSNILNITCPGCKNNLGLEGTLQDWAGQTIQCPSCGTSFDHPKLDAQKTPHKVFVTSSSVAAARPAKPESDRAISGRRLETTPRSTSRPSNPSAALSPPNATYSRKKIAVIACGGVALAILLISLCVHSSNQQVVAAYKTAVNTAQTTTDMNEAINVLGAVIAQYPTAEGAGYATTLKEAFERKRDQTANLAATITEAKQQSGLNDYDLAIGSLKEGIARNADAANLQEAKKLLAQLPDQREQCRRAQTKEINNVLGASGMGDVSLVETLRKKIGENPLASNLDEAKTRMSEAETRIAGERRRARDDEGSRAITAAIAAAKESKTYEEAARLLENSIARYSDSPNVKEATVLLARYKYELSQAARGLVKVNGGWVSKEEVQKQQLQELTQMAKKSPPDESAAIQIVTLIANAKVKGLLDNGTLDKAGYVNTVFDRRNSANCDAVISVYYDFTFQTQGGLTRKNRGYLYFYHDPKRLNWVNSDTVIDGLPRM